MIICDPTKTQKTKSKIICGFHLAPLTSQAWKANYSVSGEYEAEPTLASSSFNAYIDILVSMIVFLVVSATCLVKYGLSPAWVSVCSLAGLYYGALVLVCCKHVLCPGPPSSLFRKLYNWCRAWLPSQVRQQGKQ